ncbi:nucleolar phosphoprotein, putative [Theileria equi strain WA]|uniref:Nucleolar phosphoprotein, putative n=1 Tax=Theileria equi strain WA TaxID=1537102 RepID=L1LG15_THEEQ|nr:nucleolar phosphoprotein, putative [Theileria equi strain WA]EKX74205.1 nucleolar phosphoprotein, putative [Theileria equi strain WA]|eukprot:XP_004833657.1 nucleolar phosphoprotein, putative [Theileria equi strain WA]
MENNVVYTNNVKKNIIYVGNLPRQLTESQIKRYFLQFGDVLKIRLMKSKKTNGSRGYAFVQFENNEIAQIAADAMNNYFIDGKSLKVHVKDDEQIVKNLFKKGKPVMSKKNKIKLLDKEKQLKEAKMKSKIEELSNSLKNGKKLELDEDAKEVISMLKTKLEKLQGKRDKFATDLYDDSIATYQNVLDAINAHIDSN